MKQARYLNGGASTCPGCKLAVGDGLDSGGQAAPVGSQGGGGGGNAARRRLVGLGRGGCGVGSRPRGAPLQRAQPVLRARARAAAAVQRADQLRQLPRELRRGFPARPQPPSDTLAEP